jgi:hypothetical protein
VPLNTARHQSPGRGDGFDSDRSTPAPLAETCRADASIRGANPREVLRHRRTAVGERSNAGNCAASPAVLGAAAND